jgi:hypothetical protein
MPHDVRGSRATSRYTTQELSLRPGQLREVVLDARLPLELALHHDDDRRIGARPGAFEQLVGPEVGRDHLAKAPAHPESATPVPHVVPVHPVHGPHVFGRTGRRPAEHVIADRLELGHREEAERTREYTNLYVGSAHRDVPTIDCVVPN